MLLGGGFLLLVDLLFVAANLTKLIHGAWLPLLIGLTAFTVMTTWQRAAPSSRGKANGRGSAARVRQRLRDCKPPLIRMSGTAVFLNRGKETAPLAMRANVEHNHVLHGTSSILSIDTLPVPRLSRRRAHQRLTNSATAGRHHPRHACYGYMETPNIPAALRLLDPAHTEGNIHVEPPRTSCPRSS